MTLPASRREELVHAFGSGLEVAGEAGTTLRRDQRWATSAAKAAKDVMDGLVDMQLRPSLRRAIEETQPALVELLAATSFDDLDGEALVTWLQERIGLTFVDDAVVVPIAERDTLVRDIARAVAFGVLRDLAIESFVDHLVDEMKPWAERAGVARVKLGRFRPSFGGVWAIRPPEEQERYVATVLKAAVAAWSIKWFEEPRPVRPWSQDERFEVGDRLTHPRFGEGVVVERLDAKLAISFGGEVKLFADRTSDRSVPAPTLTTRSE